MVELQAYTNVRRGCPVFWALGVASSAERENMLDLCSLPYRYDPLHDAKLKDKLQVKRIHNVEAFHGRTYRLGQFKSCSQRSELFEVKGVFQNCLWTMVKSWDMEVLMRIKIFPESVNDEWQRGVHLSYSRITRIGDLRVNPKMASFLLGDMPNSKQTPASRVLGQPIGCFSVFARPSVNN